MICIDTSPIFYSIEPFQYKKTMTIISIMIMLSIKKNQPTMYVYLAK